MFFAALPARRSHAFLSGEENRGRGNLEGNFKYKLARFRNLFRGNGGFYVFAAGNFVGTDLSFFGFSAGYSTKSLNYCRSPHEVRAPV